MTPLNFRVIAALAIAISTTSSAFGVVTGMTNSGSDFGDVTVLRGGTSFTYDLSEVTGIADVTAFNGESASVILTGDGQALPAAGSRQTLLEDDRIDTGLINEENAGGVTAGAALTFDAPIVNSVGVDIVFFEINPGTSGDTFRVTINGVTNTIGDDGMVLTAAQQPDSDLYASTAGEVNTLAQLESDTFTKASDISGQALFAYSIDLSDFGVAVGDAVGSMEIASATSGSTGDPTFFAGLPEVPGTLVTSTLFEDEFDLDPGATGSTGRIGSSDAWTEVSTDEGAGDGNTDAGSIDNNGDGTAVFKSDEINANDFETQSITRTIDATGEFGLLLELKVLDDADNIHESSDFFDVEINTGGGFVSLSGFPIVGDFNGAASQGMQTLGFALTGADNSVFDLRITARSNVEDYFLDYVRVSSQTLVPEPATASLLVLGAAGLLRRRRTASA